MPLDFPYLVVAGPTASGKTALAIELARAFNGEVLSADARQVYAGVETLTCAPDQREREAVPHHLVGVLPPDAACDAVRYVEMATAIAGEIRARGRLPIVTGGTGLYIRALTHGLDPSPPADPELRERLERMDAATLRAELAARDPEALQRIDANNPRRLVRAIEKAAQPGAWVDAAAGMWNRALAAPAGLWLDMPRETLHSRIAMRTKTMLEKGAIAEVAALLETDLAPGVQSAIGFREITALLQAQLDRARCEAEIEAATRQYARRQRTWFRARPEFMPVTPHPGGGWPEAMVRAREILAAQTAATGVPGVALY